MEDIVILNNGSCSNENEISQTFGWKRDEGAPHVRLLDFALIQVRIRELCLQFTELL